MLAAWLHTLDPFALQFPRSWPLAGLRWYGLSYLAAFAWSYLVLLRITRVAPTPLQPQRISDMIVFVAVGIVVGGRLGYVLLYDPALLTQLTSNVPFWGVLALNQGGMASHGGMVGGLVGCHLFARKHKLPTLHLFDLMAFCAPVGIVFGRLANFINGELYGRPTNADSLLAVKFPHELIDLAYTQPLPPQTAAALIDATRAAELPLRQPPWEQAHALLDAVQSKSPLAIAAVEPLLTPRHPSQLYAAGLEGAMVMVVLLIVWTKARKPGTAAAVFGIAYSVGRILSEHWRLPDAQFITSDGTLPLITRGQWLSALLLLAGVVMILLVQRRDAAPLGGWRCQKCAS